MDDERERMSGALQENILVLLCHSDAACKTIRVVVGSPKLFESKMYREIAGIAIDWVDKYGEAIKEHLPDELEDVLKGDDKLVAASYEKLLKNLHAAKDLINSVYVISQLHKFVRHQTMKSALYAAVMAADEGEIEKVEVILQTALKSQVTNFEGGTSLGNVEESLRFLDNEEAPFLTGIQVLDDHHVGPAPGTVFLVQAPLKRGKSWMLMHLGKHAWMHGKIVVHVTLEMSEAKTTARYFQSLFAITKRDAKVRVPRFSKNADGTMSDVYFETVDTLRYDDPDIRALLAKKVRRQLARKAPFRIKGFPSGSLTMAGLEAYLDGLERHEKIVPDMLIIDYAELMKLDGKDANDKRNAIGKLYVELRGLATSRNFAVVTASQTNRTGIAKKVSDETDLSEDLSKGFTVDTIITYNQTPAEYELGLARLFVAAHRDDEGRQTALISQSYKMGQFCTDSVLVQPKYWEYLERKGRRSDDEEREGR